jgi:phosphoribosyl 1,2-cyclic phosphodiesterase
MSDLFDLIKIYSELAKSEGVKQLGDFTRWLEKAYSKEPEKLQKHHFGGNTLCTEIDDERNGRVIIDSGSGLVRAGDAQMKLGATEYHIFQTHFHWDHILGFPFFLPAYIPGMRIHIYFVHVKGEKDLKVQFNGANFPVLWKQLGATIEFHPMKIYQHAQVGDLRVTPFCLDHPGGSFGYRVESGGRSVVVGIDGEYKRISRAELGKDLFAYQDLDALIFDAQYELDELASRYDWGHCTPTVGAELALREGIKNLILAHHDPKASYAKIARMQDDTKKYVKRNITSHSKTWKEGETGPTVHSAYDGMSFRIHENEIEILS